MPPKLEKQGSKWTFRYYNADKKLCRYTCLNILRSKAKQEQIEFLATIHTSKTMDGHPNYTWTEFCSMFLQYSRQTKKAPEADLNAISTFNKHIKVNHISEIDTTLFRNYIDLRKKEGVKNTTINRDFCTFRSMFTWAINEGKYFNPHPIKPIKKYPTPTLIKTRYYTQDDIAIIKALPKDNIVKKLMLAMLYTGLRLKDAVFLKWQQIIWERKQISVIPAKTSTVKPDPIHIPLNEHFADLLREIKKENNKGDYIFGNRDGVLIDNRQASNLIFKTTKEIGIGGGAHTCRHTFISHLFMQGIDGTIIMDWANISDIKTLRVYRHLSPNYQTQTINKLPY